MGLRSTTCLETVVGAKQGCVSFECCGDHKTVTMLRIIWPPSVLGYIVGLDH